MEKEGEESLEEGWTPLGEELPPRDAEADEAASLALAMQLAEEEGSMQALTAATAEGGSDEDGGDDDGGDGFDGGDGDDGGGGYGDEDSEEEETVSHL